MARDADLLLAEATFPEAVPADAARSLSSARQTGQDAARAAVDRLVLTHLQPGTDPEIARDAAAAAYDGDVTVARPGTIVDLERS